MILSEKENAQNRIVIINRKTNESKIYPSKLDYNSISFSVPDFNYTKSDTLEISNSNMVSPEKTVRYSLKSGDEITVEEDTILGNFNSTDYETKRIYYTALS